MASNPLPYAKVEAFTIDGTVHASEDNALRAAIALALKRGRAAADTTAISAYAAAIVTNAAELLPLVQRAIELNSAAAAKHLGAASPRPPAPPPPPPRPAHLTFGNSDDALHDYLVELDRLEGRVAAIGDDGPIRDRVLRQCVQKFAMASDYWRTRGEVSEKNMARADMIIGRLPDAMNPDKSIAQAIAAILNGGGGVHSDAFKRFGDVAQGLLARMKIDPEAAIARPPRERVDPTRALETGGLGALPVDLERESEHNTRGWVPK